MLPSAKSNNPNRKPCELLPFGGTPPNMRVNVAVSVSPTFSCMGGLPLLGVKYVIICRAFAATVRVMLLGAEVKVPAVEAHQALLVGRF